MPKTKRNLGATDAGQAQRTGGLRAAGDYFSAKGVRIASNPGFANKRQRDLKQDVMKKSSKGGSTKKK